LLPFLIGTVPGAAWRVPGRPFLACWQPRIEQGAPIGSAETSDSIVEIQAI